MEGERGRGKERGGRESGGREGERMEESQMLSCLLLNHVDHVLCNERNHNLKICRLRTKNIQLMSAFIF